VPIVAGSRYRALVFSGEVFYGLIPRRLEPFGLAGVEARIPYLASLGVTGLWLSPIFARAGHDFGYGMTDYFAIDPAHGTTDDLRRVVRAAHGHGLKLILDVAPNHTSDQHPFYRDVREHGTDSSYADYYVSRDDGTHDYYFDWSNLINLNYGNPAVERHMIDALTHWIVECDIDGYRMDAAWGIRDRTPDFWPHCLKALRSCKPGLFLLAEASALDPFYLAAGFDAAYDWTDELGKWAWTAAFAPEASPAPALARALRESSDHSRVFRFLNNNDTRERFVTRHGIERFKAATALLLTLPGIPCLYMGDEAGAQFQPYGESGPVAWPDAPGLVDFHRRLIALRERALAGDADATVLETDAPDSVVAYAQPGKSGGTVVCVVNFGPAAEVGVRVDPRASGFPDGVAHDLWSGAEHAVASGEVRLPLAADGFAILEPRPSDV
jgi:cyclomaltodextrinase / maltogenic alpha-amylase / neopullulanase